MRRRRILMCAVSQGAFRAKRAAEFLGIGKSTFLRWVKEKRVPQGIHLSNRCTVWKVAELEAFLEQQASRKGGV